jgi:hypothetical protein
MNDERVAATGDVAKFVETEARSMFSPVFG